MPAIKVFPEETVTMMKIINLNALAVSYMKL